MTNWKRLRYTAWKYFRMNPTRHWWLIHVRDELRRTRTQKAWRTVMARKDSDEAAQQREQSRRDDETARNLRNARAKAKDTREIDNRINEETARRIEAELARRDAAGEP